MASAEESGFKVPTPAEVADKTEDHDGVRFIVYLILWACGGLAAVFLFYVLADITGAALAVALGILAKPVGG